MAVKTEILVRRASVKEMLLKGYSQREIAEKLNIPLRTLERDMSGLKGEVNAKLNISLENELKTYNDTQNLILREAWRLFEKSKEERIKIKALSLINRTIEERMKLFSIIDIPKTEVKNNTLTVADAIRLIKKYQKD